MEEPVHVLVVDDVGDLRDSLCLRIAALGLRCEAVETGADAISVLEWWKPLVIVIEWDLRDGSGRGLSARLRTWAVDHFRPLLIVLHSKQDEDGDVRTREDYDDYIPKSAGPETIESAIIKFLTN
ncbi:MAG TPA: response regulator [Kofleriaceae bacterium]|nr:response regulator [Kofleriaceae bacterium]